MLLHGQFEKLVSAIRMETDDNSDGGKEEEDEKRMRMRKILTLKM